MKIKITNEEIIFLANLIRATEQPTISPTEPDVGWRKWVMAPLAQHAVSPKEAKTTLTIIGILADYGVPVTDIINAILETFIENYKMLLDVPKAKKLREGQQVKQYYKCDNCGLKSSITYYPASEDDSDIILKIKKDHKERSPNCDSAMAGFCFFGEPDEIL